MIRTRVGLAALAFLTAAGCLYLFSPPASLGSQAVAGSLRIGIVLSALWLALPELNRWTNQLLLAGIFILAIVGAIWPKLFLFAAVALVVIAILKPRLKGVGGGVDSPRSRRGH